MRKNKHLYAVILAGGSGTRFWPLSRENRPKQFLRLASNKSLLQQTVERLRPAIPSGQIYIVTNAKHKQQVIQQLRGQGVSAANILLEPSGKNTAPAICWAAQHIEQRDPQAVVAIFPSDHVILNQTKFLQYLDRAVRIAEKDYLVTFGLVPTRPATGFGYFQTVPVKDGAQDFLKVRKFAEKPTLAKAKAYVRSGNYFWNSGMFVWKAAVILEEFKKYLPDIAVAFEGRTDNKSVHRFWAKLTAISIDYGILEKSKRVAAVAAPGLGWSDLGSWDSLEEVFKPDREGNVFLGDCLNIGCRGTVVRGNGKFIAAIGLDNVIIVDAGDALLVCRKDRAQEIRQVVAFLKEKQRKEV